MSEAAEIGAGGLAALAALEVLDRNALAERWQAVFGCPAPKSCQAPLLRAALAWELQRQAAPDWAGPAGVAKLRRLLRALNSSASASSAPTLSPGTRLLREWQGTTHQVTVLPAGFEHDGVVHRSLSAVARQITGTRWSGPAFFGVRG